MAILWPVTLPQTFSMDEYDEVLPDTALHFGTDAGPGKVRQRTTTNVRPLTVALKKLTLAQTVYFDTFYVTTTRGGTLPFDFPHPRLGTVSVRFKPGAPPKPRPLSGAIRWGVTFQIEVLP